MLAPLLGRAFAAAHGLYFHTGFHLARAMADHSFLQLDVRDHHPALYRQLGNAWEKARAPLQGMVINKWADTALKSDFSPRPTGDVMKKLAGPLLRLAPQWLPKLVSGPTLALAVATTAIVLMDPSLRQMVTDQATQLLAGLNGNNADIQEKMGGAPGEGRAPAVTPAAQPSAF